TQIRKYYDEVLKFKEKLDKNPNRFDRFLPYIKMLNAKTAYALGRGHITKEFKDLIKACLGNVNDFEDFNVFVSFFEAFIGFYRAEAKG
ncbi:MAG: type III-A CRISPR-associated protein Csm2, partial [Elusimicrobia bacterium]|nr:type III-A CRISPR-associated protein Csm2 [Elusimicrobiota bacterium]